MSRSGSEDETDGGSGRDSAGSGNDVGAGESSSRGEGGAGGEQDAGSCEPAAGGAALTAAQRARLEEQRQRARERRAARCQALAEAAARTVAATVAVGARDTGGGFLLEEEPAPPARAAPPPAPVAAPRERPACDECGARFAASFLWDAFGALTCDACHSPRGAHELLPRGAALAEYLLRPADVDAREPPLRALRRRNPHAPRTDMRLYLRAQLQARAELVWGGAGALEAERERRAGARGARAAAARGRRLAALRRAVRPAPARAPHAHRWGPERHDPARDTYSRACLDCPHVETYEKM